MPCTVSKASGIQLNPPIHAPVTQPDLNHSVNLFHTLYVPYGIHFPPREYLPELIGLHHFLFFLTSAPDTMPLTPSVMTQKLQYMHIDLYAYFLNLFAAVLSSRNKGHFSQTTQHRIVDLNSNTIKQSPRRFLLPPS